MFGSQLWYSLIDDCYYFACKGCGKRTSMTTEEYDSKEERFLYCPSCRHKCNDKKGN